MNAPANSTGDVRAVIFDVDGTLLDSNDAHARAWVRAFAEGGHRIRYDQVRPLIGMGGDKVIPILTGIDPGGPSAALISERRQRAFLDGLPLLRPQPGARNLVQMVREHGLKVGVASSASEEELGLLLLAAEVSDLVGPLVSKDDAGRSKPDKDTVKAAVERLQVEPSQAIMIGDTPYDIEAAEALGIPTIALRCGGWSSVDLADAIAVYDTPQDLANDYERSPLGRLRRAA